MSAVMTETDSNSLPMQKHAGGRPSKFNTRTVRKAREYINGEIDVVPTIAGLCVHLGVARKTVYEWLNKNIDEEFSNTLSLMSEVREQRLINGGLKGDYNSNIAKLVLTTSHGYTEAKASGTTIEVHVDRGKAKIVQGNQSVTVDTDTSEQQSIGTTYEQDSDA